MAPLKWHYGDVVKKRRDERHWSQEDLATQSGVSVGKIRRIESGDKSYPASAQEPLAQAFETTVAAMMAEIPASPDTQAGGDENYAASAQRLLAQAFGTTVAAMMAEIPPSPYTQAGDKEKSASG